MAFSYDQNYGRVARLYPTAEHGGRVYFRLKDGQTAMNPKAGYYFIPKQHPLYDEMVELLYMAAEKGLIIRVRAENQLVDQYAQVKYFVIDF